MIDKKVNLQLVGLDGNAFSLLGAFRSQAHNEGRKSDEIKEVIHEATSGDYNHLLATLASYCHDPDDTMWGNGC